MDTKKFRIAKAAHELEIESERLEGELEVLKERLADLEAQGVEGDEVARRERESDDATMLVTHVFSKVSRSQVANFILLDYDSKSTDPSVSMSRRTRLGTTAKLLFEIVERAMYMSSISIRNSRGFSTRITSGRRCRVEVPKLWF